MTDKKWFCINIKIRDSLDVDVQIYGDQERSEDALIIAAYVRAAIIAPRMSGGLAKEPIVEWREDP